MISEEVDRNKLADVIVENRSPRFARWLVCHGSPARGKVLRMLRQWSAHFNQVAVLYDCSAAFLKRVVLNFFARLFEQQGHEIVE